MMPGSGRYHSSGGGAQHVASVGRQGPSARPGCRAQAGAGVPQHPQRPACSRRATASFLPVSRG